MSLGFKESIEDKIIDMLLKEKLDAKNIFINLKNEGYAMSLQGLYKMLGKLCRGRILLKNKKIYHTNQEWVEWTLGRLSKERGYINISEGESITYAFEDLTNLSVYWQHIVAWINTVHPEEPMFFYEPHEIWIYLEDKYSSEEYILRTLNTNKRYGFMRIGAKTKCDIEYKNRFDGEFYHIDVSESAFKHFTTNIGDYVITTKLPLNVLKEIDDIFNENMGWNETGKIIEDILKKKMKVKFSVERNKEKALMVRKKISENHYVPKELRDLYKLF